MPKVVPRAAVGYARQLKFKFLNKIEIGIQLWFTLFALGTKQCTSLEVKEKDNRKWRGETKSKEIKLMQRLSAWSQKCKNNDR